MRMLGVLLLACLAIGSYGASLEALERELLLDILEQERGGHQSKPRPPRPEECTAENDGNQVKLPPGCSGNRCKCTFTCEDDDGEWRWDADGNECPKPRRRMPECNADNVDTSVQFPDDCEEDDSCTCTLSCEEDGGEYKWQADAESTRCPAQEFKCNAETVDTSVQFPKDCEQQDTCTCEITCEQDDGGQYRVQAVGDDCPKPKRKLPPCDAAATAGPIQIPKDCAGDTCECTFTCEEDEDGEWEWSAEGTNCPGVKEEDEEEEEEEEDEDEEMEEMVRGLMDFLKRHDKN